VAILNLKNSIQFCLINANGKKIADMEKDEDQNFICDQLRLSKDNANAIMDFILKILEADFKEGAISNLTNLRLSFSGIYECIVLKHSDKKIVIGIRKK
jgi:hypothetical protein